MRTIIRAGALWAQKLGCRHEACDTSALFSSIMFAMTDNDTPIDPRKRMQQLLSIPDRDRSDEEWDELIELEIQFAPGNRAEPGSVNAIPGAPAPARARHNKQRPGGKQQHNKNGDPNRIQQGPQKPRPQGVQQGQQIGQTSGNGGGQSRKRRRPQTPTPQE